MWAKNRDFAVWLAIARSSNSGFSAIFFKKNSIDSEIHIPSDLSNI